MSKKNENKMKLLSNLSDHIGGVNRIKYTRDGSYCLSCSDDRTIKLWNPLKITNNSSQDEERRGGGGRREDGEGDNSLLIKTYSGVHGYQILDLDISSVCLFVCLFV